MVGDGPNTPRTHLGPEVVVLEGTHMHTHAHSHHAHAFATRTHLRPQVVVLQHALGGVLDGAAHGRALVAVAVVVVMMMMMMMLTVRPTMEP